MSTTVATRITGERASPSTAKDVVDSVRASYEASQAVYPLGGRTAIDYGIPPTQPGSTLDLTSLNRVVDYTPRDMTIVVEAAVRMADLAATLAAEGQHLPIDVPRASEATIGGVVATNWCGPRRYGHGTIRDYVIGIHAVDGRGTPFKGGGRVVKNVAGYDFCKLLTGSLGTLGVITQLALKVKPRPEHSVTVGSRCSSLEMADRALTRLVNLSAPPVGIDLLFGNRWQNRTSAGQNSDSMSKPMLLARLEGTEREIDCLRREFMVASLGNEVESQAAGGLDPSDAASLWDDQIEFTDRGVGADDVSPMVIKITVRPSAVTQMIAELVACDAGCTIQAHAGNGIILARFSKFEHSDLTNVLVGKLRPAATRLGGSLIIVRSSLEGLTPHLVWGGRNDATVLLERIKQQFDPRNILNPDRFAYH